MVLQFADGGSLRDYLETKSSELNWTKKFLIAKQIVEGLAYLHKNGIVHRDLHSKNILVCEEKMIIAGFGISEYVNEASLSTSIARGMPAYIDPQCLKDPTYQRDMKSDIYSLGVILWEISSGQPPFKSFEVGYAITIHVFKGGRETTVEGTPLKFEQLYKLCWDDDPTKRPDIASVLISLNQLIEV
ncbi:kinase-like domain-containing protein [Gigaspora rosea]|uniref:Kinase-like domain-containing protein n=1 Tax=Gigaspora rosea TaxID=44941 RepID=A0A397VWB3_9GLOM|nr:kinase-like domain-containing protein [Gigaspora rosea]